MLLSAAVSYFSCLSGGQPRVSQLRSVILPAAGRDAKQLRGAIYFMSKPLHNVLVTFAIVNLESGASPSWVQDHITGHSPDEATTLVWRDCMLAAASAFPSRA
ncbi:MAG: hypothetical protein WA354_14055 [Terracidiphilus sp.]